ncbi:hypothetical protein PVA8_321 [Vibrio phage PVA8]|nr:hypothetical protein [Vibrio phage PC-Liy1]URQ03307.1 hypothetical protein PVA8_321 [Vibrio phage PVA8]WBM59040.1 hypothetical protein vBValMPVA8_318 [Vibrio phage vB_ValM_PVA8]
MQQTVLFIDLRNPHTAIVANTTLRDKNFDLSGMGLRRACQSNYIALEKQGKWRLVKCRYMFGFESMEFNTLDGVVAFINAINIDNNQPLIREVVVEEVAPVYTNIKVRGL